MVVLGQTRTKDMTQTIRDDEHQHPDEDALRALAGDASPQFTRMYAAGNPSTPVDVLMRLAEDADHLVREAVTR